MGCHDKRKNSNKVALCQTCDEIATSEGSNNCLSCHMPISLLGGHSAKMINKGLVITLLADKKDEMLKC